jgi:ATP-binding cassette, subfamily B, multidrug efflux pump
MPGISVLQKLFYWLEGLSDPFPAELPTKPPDTLFGFIAHYARPFWPLLLAASIFATVVALLEVWLFSFVGNLVDWLAEADRETFWSDYRWQLIGMALLVLVALPVLKLFYESIHHQGLLGNFAMRARWQAHRYLLRQSVEFYQNDFAGRVATKVMQTALGIRDTVMRATEVLLYVTVYFTAAVVMFAASDLRLSAPMLLWLVGYLFALRYFIPRLRDVSREQAEARSVVTGRVVDSYTNITTVKMFAHSDYEDAYAREGMDVFLDNVYRQMRLVTQLTVSLNILNSLLLFSVAGTAIWLWNIGAVTTGAIAFCVGLVMRLQGMSQWILWEVAGVFENIGVVQDGIDTIARDRGVVDVPDAVPLVVKRGAIEFRDIHFNYGKHRGDIGRGVIDGLSLSVAAGEKIGMVGRSGAGKSTIVNLLLRFYDVESWSYHD